MFTKPARLSLSTQRSALFSLGLVAAAILVWAPMLSGGFVLDDYWNIVENDRISAGETGLQYWLGVAFGAEAGPLKRPLTTLSFGLNYRLFGMDPTAFKAVNLALHLLCGRLVFALTRRLIPRWTGPTRSAAQTDALAGIVSAIWLLHPLQVSTVAYVVQRMTILSSLFTLLGLYAYVIERERTIRTGQGWAWAIAGLFVFGVLASLSKESGALIIVYALVIEGTALRCTARTALAERRVAAVFKWTLGGFAACVLIFVCLGWGWLENGYARRPFTIFERLLTEARVLWSYLSWIAWPAPKALGLHHDDIAVSRSLWAPVSTAFAVVAWVIAVWVAWSNRKHWPALAFGLFWFLGGHLMESTLIPLEIAFEHRNYLPLLGPVLAAVIAVDGVVKNARLRWSFLLIVLTGTTALTHARTTVWGDPLRHAETEAAHHPHSLRAQYDAGNGYFRLARSSGDEKAMDVARSYFMRAQALDEGSIQTAAALVRTYAGAAQVPEDVVNAFAQSLRTTRAVNTRPLRLTVNAAVLGEIALNREQIEKLITALLDNPHASDAARADGLSMLSRYHFDVVGDIQQAVSLALMAAAQAPNVPVHQIDLAELALRVGRPDMAVHHLEEAVRLDRKGIYAEDVARLRARIPDKQTAP